jgi:imidazole glycerol phosphate synthase glutamine amidotransferase subunit
VSAPRIALIEYGGGNLPSVERALIKLGAKIHRAREAQALQGCDAIILPGVGHFGALVRALEQQDLVEALQSALRRGIPFLGICLGLQALFSASEEAPEAAGLGFLAGTVRELPRRMKLPHMGWNQLRRVDSSRLLREIPDDAFFYFAHSYAATDPEGSAVAMCHYGDAFAAVIEQGNAMAVQFHPEKSGEAGARVLHNFLECVQ